MIKPAREPWTTRPRAPVKPKTSFVFERVNYATNPELLETQVAAEPLRVVVYLKPLRPMPDYGLFWMLDCIFDSEPAEVDKAVVVREVVKRGKKVVSNTRLYTFCKTQCYKVHTYDPSRVAFEFFAHPSAPVTPEVIKNSIRSLIDETTVVYQIEKMDIYMPNVLIGE